MTNTPADWTDAEIARWMAERDGWRVEKNESGLWSIDGPQFLVHGYSDEDYAWWTVRQHTNYPHSLDAAVAWLGRRGLEWRRWRRLDQICVGVASDEKWFHCFESPTCPTARALCNAGVAAEMAREASNG